MIFHLRFTSFYYISHNHDYYSHTLNFAQTKKHTHPIISVIWLYILLSVINYTEAITLVIRIA